ncbi:MAG: hypothetical protein JW969_18700 [Spirochaetales bacterium]|nr:hypothetical protein [Spirochaetales bacterium]
MKRTVLLLIIYIFSFPLFADTFFVFSCEKINGELDTYPYMVKEGILDNLFEEGHIIFDDGVNNCELSIENRDEMDKIFKTAVSGGARYIIVLFADTKREKLANKLERYESRCEYYLFDIKTRNCIGKGDLGSDNIGKEENIKGDTLLFTLGGDIAGKISLLYSSYIAGLKP